MSRRRGSEPVSARLRAHSTSAGRSAAPMTALPVHTPAKRTRSPLIVPPDPKTTRSIEWERDRDREDV